jgi:hypothetical protein
MRRAVYRDYVLEYDGVDPEAAAYGRQVVDYIEGHRVLIGLYRASHVARAAVRKYLQNFDDDFAKLLTVFVSRVYIDDQLRLNPISGERAVASLADLQARLAARGSRLVLFNFEGEFARMKELADQHALAMLVLRYPAGPMYRHRYDGHISEAGHRVVAEQLRRALVASGWLPTAKGETARARTEHAARP